MMEYITQYEMHLNPNGVYVYKASSKIAKNKEQRQSDLNQKMNSPFSQVNDLFFETYLNNMFSGK